MPKMLWATLCAEAVVTANNTINIRDAGVVNAGVTTLAEVPPLFIAGQIFFEADELQPDELPQHQTRVLDPSGRAFWQYDGMTFPVTGSGGTLTSNFALDLGGIPFRVFGPHTIVVAMADGTELARLPFDLVQTQPRG